MRKKAKFVFGLHNHQPVGNFDHVIEEAYLKAYLPFVEVMKDYPDISFSVHNSGILWDWLEEKHPEYLETIASMVSAGRVELMSAGYYEPILTVIPERDRQGQLSMMNDYLQRRFNIKPRGCWLTERIWDPHLPLTLSEAGLEYVVVDDSHFKSTGFDPAELKGYFFTEENGSYIKVFPIDRNLRYLIPFRGPEETVEYLRSVFESGEDGETISVLADDGEKFGLWTGTHSLCYKENWLRRFCDALLANRDWLETVTFSEAMDASTARSIVYLPTASYTEMMEWALPLKAQEEYHRAKEALESNGTFPEPAEAIRGGLWRNVLVKYEESNWMHKRMMMVSDLLEEYRKNGGSGGVWEEARGHLYQAQCNCAYWHGLFGGLYLPHLRSAIFRHLIAAERAIDEETAKNGDILRNELRDIDGDGIEELIISTGFTKIFMKLKGAVAREIDLVRSGFNLTDTLTRREEYYHRKIVMSGRQGGKGKAVSIHDMEAAKEEGLEKLLFYDRYPRASLVDHFIDPGCGIDAFARSAYVEKGDFAEGAYSLEVDGDPGVFHFRRNGSVEQGSGRVGLQLIKSICLSDSGRVIDVRYSLNPSGRMKTRFAVENVISFLAGNAPDRYFTFPGRKILERNLSSTGEEESLQVFEMTDEYLGVTVSFEFDPAARFWRFPVETISNSDSGFERVYQGSALVPVWDLDIPDGGTLELNIRLRIGSI